MSSAPPDEKQTYDQVVHMLADAITSLHADHPVRVGIDGRSTAGKTTLADRLSVVLQERRRPVLRVSFDDFHGFDLQHRLAMTPSSYYDNGFDFQAFRALVLDPLGPYGSRRCRTAIWDSLHDCPTETEWTTVPDDAVAVIDGTFLLRPKLADAWEYVVWLDIDMETMIERARRRDVAWVGSEAVVEKRYREHWISTHELYEADTDARARADAVIDNRDVSHPILLRLTRR